MINPNSQSASIIKLIDILAPVVSSREIINKILEQQIREENSALVVLDFNKIEFLSRSAAHELLKLKEKLENQEANKKEISFVNMNTSVASMIRTVAANRAYSMSEKIPFHAEKVDILELV